MEATNTLKVTPRQIQDGPTPRALRRSGFMPAVVYGQGKQPVLLTVEMNEFKNLLNHITTQSLISLNAEADKTLSEKIVMIKELQRHPVSQKFIHADFYEVDMAKEIRVNINVEPMGTSKGEEEDDGVLQIIRREVEVSCLPGDIPESIEIDISQLQIGDSIHVSEITTPPNVALTWDPEHEADYTILAIAAPTLEEVTEEEAEEDLEAAEGEAAGSDETEGADEDSSE